MRVALATFQFWPQAHRGAAPRQRRAPCSRRPVRHHHARAAPARDPLLGPAAPALPAPGQPVLDPRQGRPMRGRQQHFPQRAPRQAECL